MQPTHNENNDLGAQTPPQKTSKLPPLKVSSRTQSLLCLNKSHTAGEECPRTSSFSLPNKSGKLLLNGQRSSISFKGLGLPMSARSFSGGLSYRLEEEIGNDDDELIKGGFRSSRQKDMKEEDEFAFVAAVRRQNSQDRLSDPMHNIRPFSSRHRSGIEVGRCPTGPLGAFCGSPVTGCLCHVIPAKCPTGPKGAFCGSPVTGCRCHERRF